MKILLISYELRVLYSSKTNVKVDMLIAYKKSSTMYSINKMCDIELMYKRKISDELSDVTHSHTR